MKDYGKKDIKIRVNAILWENAVKRIETDFGKKHKKTNCMLIIMLPTLSGPTTQQNCLRFLNNDNTDKLVLLDVLYIGS